MLIVVSPLYEFARSHHPHTLLRMVAFNLISLKVITLESSPRLPHLSVVCLLNPFIPSHLTNICSVGGSITLKSNDPFTAPNIDPGYFTSPYDLLAMREAIKAAQRFVAAPAFSDYIVSPAGGLESVKTDEEYEKYIREQTHSADHLVGTCAMSAKGAKTGVVDPDLKVKGIPGLRIVDASVMVGA
jgi:hypothetical protein